MMITGQGWDLALLRGVGVVWGPRKANKVKLKSEGTVYGFWGARSYPFHPVYHV